MESTECAEILQWDVKLFELKSLMKNLYNEIISNKNLKKDLSQIIEDLQMRYFNHEEN